MACEEDQELWEEIDETDDYVRLPNQYELHEKSIMEKFAYESGNKRVSEVLFDALRRRHPYRCFKDKINDLSVEEASQLLSSNGMLVKRPLLILDDQIIIGYKQELYEKL